MNDRSLWLACSCAVAVLLVGCGERAAPESTVVDTSVTESTLVTPTTAGTSSALLWTEAEVTIRFGELELFGVLTLPDEQEVVPAIVLVSGSGDLDGLRSGARSRPFVDHARRLTQEGFAVLRYDPPGVGRSVAQPGLPTLERRVEETIAVVRYLAGRPEIDAGTIGLQGWSQGPWVMAMTAARHPDEVAFLVSVVGSGQTVAEQQLYGVEAQSRAADLGEAEVATAVLFQRLLIDWQLVDPIHRDVNDAEMAELGDGPWTALADVVYGPDTTAAESVPLVVDILDAVADEPWAAALHLRDLYLPQFEALSDATPEQLAALRALVDADLRTDPADFLVEVRAPVLAIFGEHDLNIDSTRSAALYEQYLTEADNQDVTIVILPDVGHDIGLSTPGYVELLTDWLRSRHPSSPVASGR